MKKKLYLRGELYYAKLGHGIGSEQSGNRPVVILQNNLGNQHSPTVIVAPVTKRKADRKPLPAHYPIGPENGLSLPSVVLLEQLRTIDKRRLGNYIGRLKDGQMQALEQALAISLGLRGLL